MMTRISLGAVMITFAANLFAEPISSVTVDGIVLDTTVVTNSMVALGQYQYSLPLEYSTSIWNEADPAYGTAAISVNDEGAFETEAAEGTFVWEPAKAGRYVLKLTIGSVTYQKTVQVNAPTVSFAREGYSSCKLTPSDGVSPIRYTTDGSDPTASSALYTGPFEVLPSEWTTVKARTFGEGYLPGEIGLAMFEKAGATVCVARASCEIDNSTGVKYINPETLSLPYDVTWEGDEFSKVVLSADGEVFAERTGVGTVDWMPSKEGETTLSLKTLSSSGEIVEEYTAEFYVYPSEITVTNGLIPLKYQLAGDINCIRKIVIPESITKLCGNLLEGCTGIVQVTLPASLQIDRRFIPGLKQAKFNSNNDCTSSILDSPTCVNVSGVLMGNAYDTESVTRTYSDPLYGGSYKWNSRNTTFGYYGYMYMVAGRKYVFGKYFDDSVLVKIDGVEVLKNTDHTAFATGIYTPETTGWHEIEVRLADGTGEKGPKGMASSGYWSGNLGVAWRDDGITDALPESGWKKLMDPGDGSLFRFYDDSYSVSGMNQLFLSSYASITNVTLTGDVLMLPVDRFVGCDSLETVRLADSSLVLHLGGENSWRINEDGILQSAKIGNDEESSTEITVEGPGELSFRWKASSECYGDEIFDYAYLTIDGVETDLMIGGHTDWENVEVDIKGSGLHTIKWIYAKDEVDEENVGEDCAWVDSIKFRPNRTVSFDIGLASGDAPKASSDISETVIKLPEYVGFDRPKYTLIGWSDGKDVYAPNGDYNIPVTSITLVAVYEANTIAEPTITSEEVENGGVIDTASAMFSITADAGTAIYYTLDGSTPNMESRLYTGPFAATPLGDVTVKAIAVRNNYFDSPVATFTFKRLPYSAAECLNIEFGEALNGGDSSWFRVLGDEAHDGEAALRSGVIEDNGLTWVSTTVTGEGTISFWWKTSSEISRGRKYDYVSFLVDDVEQAWMGGITDWSNVVCNITGSGTHTLKWEYRKNDKEFKGEDCAWLDEVKLIDWSESSAPRWPIVYENLKGAENPNPGKYYEGTPLAFLPLADVAGYTFVGWTPSQITADMTGMKTVTANWSWMPQDITVESSITGGKEFEVKGEWASEELDRRFGAGTKQEFIDRFGDNLSLAMSKKTGKKDQAGNELCVWHDYVAGTDPTDIDSVFRAEIEMANGLPIVSWWPNLNTEEDERVYLVYGKEKLTDAWHLPINTLDHFFRVEVSMPFDNSIVFDSNGGPSIDSVSIRIGQPVGELPTPTREGYTFAGWWTATEGGMPITAETIVTNDMTLCAHWKINTYTITFIEFRANGVTSYTVHTRTYGATLGYLPTPTRNGYAFDGWWTAASGGAQVTASTTVTSNITYYAHWTKIYTVILDANGGEGSTTLTRTHGATLGSLPTPTRNGYSFDGWWTAASGGTQVATSTTVTGDVTYYAHWTNTYTVTLDANGGEGSTTLTRTYGSTLGSLPIPTREGYTFDGWWTAASGGSLVTADTTITGDVTYYAHWTKKLDIADGVEATDFVWTTGGEAGWLWQSEVSHDGEDAVSSGVISNNETSWMQTTVAGPAEVSFWWRVSSEDGWDKLKFYIDDSEQTSISGETSWEQKTYTLTSGNHTLKWEYSKDVSVDRGSDCGWVDQVTILPKNPTNNDANGSHDKVQLWEGGPYWATTNIGADNPWDYGYYFWWGDTVGYKRENGKWVASDESNSNFSFGSSNARATSFKSNFTLQEEGWITSDGVLCLEHDAANMHWGGNWRMPTKAEFEALNSNCDWTWATTNGVDGYIVRGRGAYSSNSIFLPCAGFGDGISLAQDGSEGQYCSSIPNPDYAGGAASWFLYFDSSGTSNSYRNRWCGLSIRPVVGAAE